MFLFHKPIGWYISIEFCWDVWNTVRENTKQFFSWVPHCKCAVLLYSNKNHPNHFEILKIQMGIPPISPFSLDAPKTTLVRNANGAIAGFSTWFLSRYVSNSFLAYLNSENMTWPLHQPASANERAFVSTWKEATANEKRQNCAGGSTDFFEKKGWFCLS